MATPSRPPSVVTLSREEMKSRALASIWRSSATYLTEISRTSAPGGETVTVRAETTLTAAPAQFLRLRVTRL